MGALTLAIVLHAGLGVVLALLVFASGLGVLGALRGREALLGADAVFAYPLGLGVCVVSAVLTLVSPWLAPLAVLLVTAPLVAFLARRAEGIVTRAGRPLLVALPGVVGLPIVLGFLLHGPSRDLGSRAYGDMLAYVDTLVSATQSIAPLYDLLVEGERRIYAEAASSFLGGALAELPGFDIILFHTTTLPAFLLASLAIGLGLLGPGRARETSPWLPAVALLAVSTVIYPTWIVESPPVALAAPLALVIYRLWEAPPATSWLTFFAVLCAAELLATKVVATIPLAVVAALAIRRRYLHRFDARQAALVVGGLVAAGGVAIALLFLTASWFTRLFTIEFLPADAVRGLRDQLDTRNAQALAPTFEVIGQIMLLTALVRARHADFALSLALSICAVWFVGGQGFDAALGTSILLAAILFWRRPALFAQQRALVLAAATALLFSSWLRDISGVRAALALVILLSVTLVAAFEGASRSPLDAARRLLYPAGIALTAVLFSLAGAHYVGFAVVLVLAALALVRRPAVAVAALALGLAASTALAARSDDLRLGHDYYPLTSEDYEVWQRVTKVVPRDGLVFTSMTGKRIDGRHGWNNYPSIAGRQLYLAGWYDGRLVSDRAELDRRLALNRRILTGALSPMELVLERRFSSYYAVLRQGERTPSSFRLLYANRLFALYRISA